MIGCLLAGLFSGLAAATKYNFGIVLLAPLAACGVLAMWSATPVRLLLASGGTLLLGALVGFLVGMPETVWAFAEVREGILHQVEVGERRWPGQAPEPPLFLYAQALLLASGWPGIVAAVAGLAFSLTAVLPRAGNTAASHAPTLPRSHALAIAIALPSLAYLAYMSTKELFFARFALPLVPFVSLFGAYGLVRLVRAIPGPRLRRAVAAVACLALLGPPTIQAVRLAWLANQTDTRVLAERWLRESVPPGTAVAAQTYSLPNRGEGGDLRRVFDLTSFTPLSEGRQFIQLACAGNRYLLTSSFRVDRQRTVGRPGAPSGYELLAAEGRPVAAFRPTDGPPPPFNPDDIGLPFWHLARYERSGPTITVYELPPRTAC